MIIAEAILISTHTMFFMENYHQIPNLEVVVVISCILS